MAKYTDGEGAVPYYILIRVWVDMRALTWQHRKNTHFFLYHYFNLYDLLRISVYM